MKRKLQKENFLNKKIKLSESMYGTLPNEILQNIFTYLLPTKKSEIKEFTNLTLVSKPWYQFFNNEEEEEEKETNSKIFWLDFYKKYFELEHDLFQEEIKTLTTKDVKEIFFERFQQENVENAAYVYHEISTKQVETVISEFLDEMDSLDSQTISELVNLLTSKKSLIITDLDYDHESVQVDGLEYDYRMDIREYSLGISGTIFLRNSFSIDFSLDFKVTFHYDDEVPEKEEFELKINEKKIVEFYEETVVDSGEFEKICDSVDVKNYKTFFILLLVYFFGIVEDHKLLNERWKGYKGYGRNEIVREFKIMGHMEEILVNSDLYDIDDQD
jgi:hypothetical protein